ncbi:MAG: type II toxin-antitoxin system HicA family toxin [Odoribacter splanchnicus]|nr:type II toxin-antitoxin system HicA family toxin [Odoribacter splanchnicus]
MKTSELIKLLLAAGCYIVRNGGNHDIWFSPITGNKFPVGRHQSQEVPKGTERSIRKQAGI